MEGTNKKFKGGTMGKSLSASHNFHDITFAINQKKQISLVTIIFFERIDRLENAMRNYYFERIIFLKPRQQFKINESWC